MKLSQKISTCTRMKKNTVEEELEPGTFANVAACKHQHTEDNDDQWIY